MTLWPVTYWAMATRARRQLLASSLRCTCAGPRLRELGISNLFASMSAFASGELDVVAAFMLLPEPLNCFVRLAMDESRRRASSSAHVLLSAPVATGEGRMGGDGAPLGVT